MKDKGIKTNNWKGIMDLVILHPDSRPKTYFEILSNEKQEKFRISYKWSRLLFG